MDDLQTRNPNQWKEFSQSSLSFTDYCLVSSFSCNVHFFSITSLFTSFLPHNTSGIYIFWYFPRTTDAIFTLLFNNAERCLKQQTFSFAAKHLIFLFLYTFLYLILYIYIFKGAINFLSHTHKYLDSSMFKYLLKENNPTLKCFSYYKMQTLKKILFYEQILKDLKFWHNIITNVNPMDGKTFHTVPQPV